MPSGQYFYTNPQAAAVANNLSKIFFGDPEAEARRKQIEGIMLENQIKQQQLDENNTVNEARGSISRLFSTMSPNDVSKNAPAFYSEFARLSGRDGVNANDGSTWLRGYAANAGADDQTIARAFVGAGNGLGTNEGVSLGDRNALLKTHLAPQYYNTDQREKGADRRHSITVHDADETVYTQPGTPNEGVFNASPEAVSNAFKIGATKGSGSKTVNNVSPAESIKLGNLIGGAATGMDNLATEERMAVLARASQIYQATRDAGGAAKQAVDELTEEFTPEPSGLSQFNPFGGPPTSKRRMRETPVTTYAPTGSEAETAAANGVVTPQTAGPKVSAAPTPISKAFGNEDQATKTVVPKQAAGTRESPIPFDSVAELKPGLFYMRNGAVREYLGGPVRDSSSWRGVKK